MGLFDWMFGKKPAGRPRLPRPKVVQDLGDDSPYVVIDNGKVSTVMDREMFEYLYGDSDAPDPSQRDLDQMLATITRVRVVSSGVSRGKAMGTEVVIDRADAGALAALRKSLRIVEDPRTFSHCGCLGGPTLELFAGEQLAATIGLQHGHAIRWSNWKHDARLREGKLLSAWLTDNGLDLDLLELLFHNQYGLEGLLREGPAPLTRAEQRLRIADRARLHGDLAGARQACEDILRVEPTLGFGYAVRALIRDRQGDPAGCIADCTQAIECGLRQAEIFFARAVARDTLGLSREAEEDCTTALTLDQKHINALNSRGLIRTRLNRLDDALADFAEATRLAPDWGLPYLNRSQLHLQRNDLDAAITDLDRVLGLMREPAKPEEYQLAAKVYANRGHAYRLKGDEDRASADFQEAERFAKGPPPSKQPGACSYCQATGDCYCKRTSGSISEQCARCGGSGKCHVCSGTGKLGKSD
jgi:tetratricopeptide (TPR) repeat protein